MKKLNLCIVSLFLCMILIGCSSENNYKNTYYPIDKELKELQNNEERQLMMADRYKDDPKYTMDPAKKSEQWAVVSERYLDILNKYADAGVKAIDYESKNASIREITNQSVVTHSVAELRSLAKEASSYLEIGNETLPPDLFKKILDQRQRIFDILNERMETVEQ